MATLRITASSGNQVTLTVDHGQMGAQGLPGQGVPVGGTAGQVLAKVSSANYDTQWVSMSGLIYQGTWDAATNTPTLESSVGTVGFYYIVTVAGTTDLDGITDWKVGDWAIFSGTVWQKLDNSETVNSVNGQTGTVVLTASDVSAPSTAGVGATGTWGIDISGNAATATTATTATSATNADNATNAINATNALTADSATTATTAATANDLAGGAANQIVYQDLTNSTNFIDAPLVANKFLKFDGTDFVWDDATGGGGVSQIVAGTNVTISPVGGTGVVTINATGGTSLYGQTQNVSPFETSLGFEAGNSNTGANNTYLGYQAGRSHTGATNSVVIGYQAFDVATIPSNNVVIGTSACGATSNTSQNVVIGYNAAGTTTALGGDSVIIGNDAGRTVTGTSNVLIGSSAGNNVTTGSQMVGVGLGCFGAATAAAAGAVAVGHNALGSLTTGATNTAIGYTAGDGLTTGSSNTYVGYNSGGAAITSSSNTFIGYNAGALSTAGTNTAIGSTAGAALTTGTGNTFVGSGSGNVVTTGANNTIIGNYGGDANTMANNFIAADGAGNRKLQVSNTGALSINGGGYGSVGTVLSSTGVGGAPVWTPASTQQIVNATSNYTIQVADSMIFANANSGGFTVTLPSATSSPGATFTVKRIDNNDTNILTVNSAGGLVEGVASVGVPINYGYQFVSNGTNWYITLSYSAPAALQSPQLLSAMGGDGVAIVSFDPVPGATNYTAEVTPL